MIFYPVLDLSRVYRRPDARLRHTSLYKAAHQLQRGARRRITARDFNTEMRDQVAWERP